MDGDDDDGFIKVSRKKKSGKCSSHQVLGNHHHNQFNHAGSPGKSRHTTVKNDDAHGNDGDGNRQTERVLKEICKMREVLETSAFFKSLKLILSKVEHELDTRPVEIISYGIGNVSSCKLSLHQLLLMQILADHLQISSANCHLYDPCFTTSDLDLLTQLNFDIIQDNEECKHPISMPTLFYMPHCGRPMYNNVLSSNWTRWRLSRICILGNSFQSIVNNTLNSDLSLHYPCIDKIFPHVKEFKIENSFVYPDVFNNLSIHLFDKRSFKNIRASLKNSNGGNSGDNNDVDGNGHGDDGGIDNDNDDDDDNFWLCPADVVYNCNEEMIKRIT